MPKYEITIAKTIVAEVTAANRDEAYELYHNRDNYDSERCIEEETLSVIELEETLSVIEANGETITD